MPEQSYGTRSDRFYGAPACVLTGHLEATPGDGFCTYCGLEMETPQDV